MFELDDLMFWSGSFAGTPTNPPVVNPGGAGNSTLTDHPGLSRTKLWSGLSTSPGLTIPFDESA